MLRIRLAPSDRSFCMTATSLSLPPLAHLREHVNQVLCDHDRLDPKVTPLHETIITRAGMPCGILVKVFGPRKVQTQAVWTTAEKRILLYDSTGARIAETRLRRSPNLAKSAA